MTSLDGPRSKLTRADKHLKVATRLMRSYVRRECKAISQLNPETMQMDLVAYLPPVSDAIGLVVGDCIHNMRSALDHVVYQLVLSNANRPPNTPSIHTQFPICDTREGFKGQVQRQRIRGVCEDAAALIDALQPYHRRERGLDYTKYPLWVLGNLDNIDKHRRLALTSGVGFESNVRLVYSDGESRAVTHAGTRIRHGTVLTSYGAPKTDDGYVDVKGRLAAYVAFNEVIELPSITDADVAYVCRQILEMLRDKILPEFEALLSQEPSPEKG